jgi:hypothetical protein
LLLGEPFSFRRGSGDPAQRFHTLWRWVLVTFNNRGQKTPGAFLLWNPIAGLARRGSWRF